MCAGARVRVFLFTAALLSCLATSRASAHPFGLQLNPSATLMRRDVNANPKDVSVLADMSGDDFKIDLFLPLGPLLKDSPRTEAERDGQERVKSRMVDFVEENFSVEFALPGADRADSSELQRIDTAVSMTQACRLGEIDTCVSAWVIRLEGAIPPSARELRVVLSPMAMQSFGRFTFLVRQGGGVFEQVIAKEATAASVVLPARLSKLAVARLYVRLGFLHIIPKGLDHILFVLGLFFLGNSLRALLWQVSAFTAAHSVTLGLSMAGVWQVPGEIVEPIIAASIVYVAVENILTDKLNPRRTTLVFVFGLLHGLGFAGVLGEIGMPPGEFVTALLTFNVGVEVGQLTVIALAFALVGGVRNRRTYRPWIAVPASFAIGLVGVYWTIERIFF